MRSESSPLNLEEMREGCPLNFYPRHIGDLFKKTLGLSFAQRGAYDLMMDLYYCHELPLPLEDGARYRLLGATTKADKTIADYVLRRYFTEAPDGWRNKRCDEEIAAFRAKSATARASALAGVEARSQSRELLNRDKRRARMANSKALGTHTEEQWTALVDFCGRKCVKCSLPESTDKDHIKPVYQGGSDAIDNLQPLCASCNASKGAEAIDYRPPGWQAAVAAADDDRSIERSLNEGSERSLGVGAANHEPLTNNHTGTANRSTGTKPKRERPKEPAYAPPDWVPAVPWADFVEARRKAGKPMTYRAQELAVMQLEAMREGGQDPAAVLNQSVIGGWTSLRPVRADYGAAPPPHGRSGLSPAGQATAAAAERWIAGDDEDAARH